MDRWLHRNWQAPLISLDSLQLKFLVVINRMYKNLWKGPWWIWFINYTPSSKYFSSLGALQFFFLWKYLSHYHDMVSSLQAKIYHIQLQGANMVIGIVDRNIRLQEASEGTRKHGNIPEGIDIHVYIYIISCYKRYFTVMKNLIVYLSASCNSNMIIILNKFSTEIILIKTAVFSACSVHETRSLEVGLSAAN